MLTPNRFIDHTLLKQDALSTHILQLCEEARTHRFMSVCIQPHFVLLAKKSLRGSDVLVCTVIGFPLGQHTSSIKLAEAKQALEDGADELDMVINLSWVKERNDHALFREIHAIKDACGARILKVILETSLLQPDDIVFACQVCERAGADFVKTSTGFAQGGATVDAVTLMRQTVGPTVHVKASGGIRDRITFDAMVAAGATRIGTSSGIAIIKGESSTSSY
jgi:deoxyribose-phosphate aldolase